MMKSSMSLEMLLVLKLSLLLANHISCLTMTADPCDYHDGSGKTQLDLAFRESYGYADHLPTLGEETNLTQIHGTVRPENDTALASRDTVVLKLWDTGTENKFSNGTSFSALNIYFRFAVRSGAGYVSLKQGVDREKMAIYTPGMPGVTNGSAVIKFHVECIPDDASYTARNFTARVVITDVNDNAPQFYNISSNLAQGNFTVLIRENTPKDLLVFKGPIARDKDESLNAMTRVHVLRNPYFKTVENSSEILLYTKRQICYEYVGEQNATISVLVVAVDSPANTLMSLTFTATVTFTIIDEEDLPPKFLIPDCLMHKSQCVSPTYSTSVVRGLNTTTGPLIMNPGPIIAVKQDALSFGIRYSLVESYLSSNFWIDETTGQVTQLQSINHQVVLAVKATKWTDQSSAFSNGRYSLALLIVSVEPQDAPDTTDGSATRTTPPTPSGVATTTLLLYLIPGVIAEILIVVLVNCLTVHCRRRRKAKLRQAGRGVEEMSEQETRTNKCSHATGEDHNIRNMPINDSISNKHRAYSESKIDYGNSAD